MNNNNEQGSAGTPQERAAAPVASGTLGYRSISHQSLCFAAPTQATVPQRVEVPMAGVFKGADGLRKLADNQAFWDQQPYGTRLYFGDGIADYLHRDVLRAAVEGLAAPVAREAEQMASAQAKTYTRKEVQRWRDDVAHAAADMVQRVSSTFGDGEWSWLVNDIRSLAATTHPTPSDSASVDTAKALRDAVAEGLGGLYWCGRVWSAWGVGTMSQDDFTPADEDEDCINNVLDAVKPIIESLIAARVAGVRKDALEEAAKEADHWQQINTSHKCGNYIAGAIRALIHSPATGSKEGGAA